MNFAEAKALMERAKAAGMVKVDEAKQPRKTYPNDITYRHKRALWREENKAKGLTADGKPRVKKDRAKEFGLPPRNHPDYMRLYHQRVLCDGTIWRGLVNNTSPGQ